MVPEQDEPLGYLLKELMYLLSRRSTRETMELMRAAKLSLPQIVALHILHHQGPQSISAIAEYLNHSLPATSQLVDRMVGQGFVLRSEDQRDRRNKQIAMAPAGITLLEQLLQARIRDMLASIAPLSPDLRQQFQLVLAQVVAQLREVEKASHPDREKCGHPLNDC